MAHNRKLALSGVSLTKSRPPRFKPWLAAGPVRDELEREMIDSGYLDGAPFKWVGLIIRYGLVDEDEPHYQGIDKKDGELALAIEVDVRRLLDAPQNVVAQIHYRAALLALVYAGKK